MSAAPVVARASALSRVFGAGTDAYVAAVRDASLDIVAGELALVTGPSGSGKTTLLSMVGVLLAPSSGELELAGVRTGSLSQPALTQLRLRNVGFVFQGFRLIDELSVAENVELPLNLAGMRRPASRRRALALLDELGLANRSRFSLPALSGGEKQRVAIARAFANDPPLLLADEPTGSLDSRAGKQVIELLHEAARERGKAVLVVSHDMRLRRYADRLYEMEDGRVARRVDDSAPTPAPEGRGRATGEA